MAGLRPGGRLADGTNIRNVPARKRSEIFAPSLKFICRNRSLDSENQWGHRKTVKMRAVKPAIVRDSLSLTIVLRAFRGDLSDKYSPV